MRDWNFRKFPQVIHSRKSAVGVEILHAAKLAVFTVPYPPVTDMIGTKLVCCCRRSKGFNLGCRICFFVDIGNKSFQLRSVSNVDLGGVIDASASEFLVRIGKVCSFIRLKLAVNEHKSMIDYLASLVRDMKFDWLMHAYDIERFIRSDRSVSVLNAVSQVLRVQIQPVVHHIRNVRRVTVYGEIESEEIGSYLAENFDQVSRCRNFLLSTNPKKFIDSDLHVTSDKDLPNFNLEGDIPVRVYVSNVLVEADRIAKSMAKLTVSPDYINYLDDLHRGVLIHSAPLVWRICHEVLESFISQGVGKESFDDIFGPNFPVSIESGDSYVSANVFDYIESLSFIRNLYTEKHHTLFLLPEQNLDRYGEMFKMLISVEFALHSLTQTWKHVQFWEHDAQLQVFWWTFHSHMSSIRSYLRLVGVESNQQKLMVPMTGATSWFEQINAYSRFMHDVQRDLFLLDSASLFKHHIRILSKCAVDFKLVTERCRRFELTSINVWEQLTKVRNIFDGSSKFLRNNLKPHVWTFI